VIRGLREPSNALSFADLRIKLDNNICKANLVRLCILFGIPPARRERIKSFIDLSEHLLKMDKFSASNVGEMITHLRLCECIAMANVVEEYAKHYTPSPKSQSPQQIERTCLNKNDVFLLKYALLSGVWFQTHFVMFTNLNIGGWFSEKKIRQRSLQYLKLLNVTDVVLPAGIESQNDFVIEIRCKIEKQHGFQCSSAFRFAAHLIVYLILACSKTVHNYSFIKELRCERFQPFLESWNSVRSIFKQSFDDRMQRLIELLKLRSFGDEI